MSRKRARRRSSHDGQASYPNAWTAIINTRDGDTVYPCEFCGHWHASKLPGWLFKLYQRTGRVKCRAIPEAPAAIEAEVING